AEATGKPERHIQRAARRGNNIGLANLHRIAGTCLDKPSELDALVGLDAAKREELIDRAAKGEKVTARPRSTGAQDKSWRVKFTNLIKSALLEDKKWALGHLADSLSIGPVLHDLLSLDPKTAVEAVIEVAGASPVLEAALSRLAPEMRFALGE